jgi:hypothetical protein
MLKTLIKISSLACLLCLGPWARGQAVPISSLGRFQVGGGFSFSKPAFWTTPIGDPQYSTNSIGGITGYADYDLTPFLGIEGDFHGLALITALDRAELSYLVGPRIKLPIGRFTLYGKGMYGIGDLFIQEQQDNVGIQSGSGAIYSYGGGLDYQYSPKIVIRLIDFEDQKWPSYGSGISPTVITFGVAYRFH